MKQGFADDHLPTLGRVLKWIFLLFSLWIGWLILSPYPHYLPPDFDFGFLRNKSDFFYRNGYALGFFAHIIAAPLALFLGTFQSSGTIRRRWPVIHRRLGRCYCVFVLAFAAPGGLLMAQQAYGGLSNRICFSLIAVTTWWTTWIVWRAAKRNELAIHRRWMQRSFALILSAIFLRMFHIGIAPLGMDHQLTYQIAAWSSWILPLAGLEIIRLWNSHEEGNGHESPDPRLPAS